MPNFWFKLFYNDKPNQVKPKGKHIIKAAVMVTRRQDIGVRIMMLFMQCNSPCYCLLYIDCQLEFQITVYKTKDIVKIEQHLYSKVLDCEMVNPSVYVICIATV